MMLRPYLLSISFSCIFLAVNAQTDDLAIYQSDSLLTKEFVQHLCKAARSKQSNSALFLEDLINKAAGTNSKDSLQSSKIFNWHKKYAAQCICPSTKKLPEGDILRQIVLSDNRDFANKIGPKNRFPLYLAYKDPNDGMNIMEYINSERIKREEKYDNKRFEFQQDKKWRNIMFFYFLFSEYNVN